MKLSIKMMLLFSAMMLLALLVLSSYAANTSVQGANAFTQARFRNMSSTISWNIQTDHELMEMAMRELTDNTSFMAALNQIVRDDSADHKMGEAAGRAAMQQLIADNPARVLHTVKEKKKACGDDCKQYTQTEIEALLSSMEKGDLTRNALRDTAMVALALGSGLRAFELCSLNVSHLSGIQSGAVAVERKGGGWSEVSVADFVYPHVARYLLTRRGAQPNEPLFLSQKGNRMTPNSLWKTLAYKEKQLGLKTGVHIFRHTFLSDIEHDPKGGAAMARDLAGHKSIQITNTYLHTTPQERQEAVNHMGYAHLLNH